MFLENLYKYSSYHYMNKVGNLLKGLLLRAFWKEVHVVDELLQLSVHRKSQAAKPLVVDRKAAVIIVACDVTLHFCSYVV